MDAVENAERIRTMCDKKNGRLLFTWRMRIINDATDLLVSATELFINEMMPRVHGETEVISYKHDFFIFKIKKN
jgi:hypothetical protein